MQVRQKDSETARITMFRAMPNMFILSPASDIMFKSPFQLGSTLKGEGHENPIHFPKRFISSCGGPV